MKRHITITLVLLALPLALLWRLSARHSFLPRTVASPKPNAVLPAQVALKGTITALAWSPDGTQLASAIRRRDADEEDHYSLQIRDVRRQVVVRSMQEPKGNYGSYIDDVAFAPDGKALFADERYQGQGAAIQIWDFPASTLRRLPTANGPLRLLLQGDMKAAIGRTAPPLVDIATWDVKTLKMRKHFGLKAPSGYSLSNAPSDMPEVAYKAVWNWILSPDGTRGAIPIFQPDKPNNSSITIVKPAAILIFDATNGRTLKVIRTPFKNWEFDPLAFSSDNRYLLMNSDGIEVVDTTTGKVSHRFHDDDNVGDGLFSPDGKFLAFIQTDLSQSNDGIKLYETKTWRRQRIIKARAGLSTLAFSFDSNFVAAGSQDGTVQIWRVR